MSYKISEIIDSLKQYFDKTGRRIIIEYCLIDGVNISDKDAEKITWHVVIFTVGED